MCSGAAAAAATAAAAFRLDCHEGIPVYSLKIIIISRVRAMFTLPFYLVRTNIDGTLSPTLTLAPHLYMYMVNARCARIAIHTTLSINTTHAQPY